MTWVGTVREEVEESGVKQGTVREEEEESGVKQGTG